MSSMYDDAAAGIERVETPERVELSIDVAGVGSRAAACILDHLLCFLVLVVVGIALALSAIAIGAWAIAVFLIAAFLVQWFYFAVFEARWGGQTPGKRALELRVQRVGGYPIGWSEALIRNFLRPVDSLFAYAIGIIVMLLTARSQRIGDLAAGTIVVRERGWGRSRLEGLGYEGVAFAAESGRVAGPDLSAREFELLHDFLARRAELEPGARVRIAATLAECLRGRLAGRGALPEAWTPLGPEAFLVAVEDAFRGEAPSEDLLPRTRQIVET